MQVLAWPPGAAAAVDRSAKRACNAFKCTYIYVYIHWDDHDALPVQRCSLPSAVIFYNILAPAWPCGGNDEIAGSA